MSNHELSNLSEPVSIVDKQLNNDTNSDISTNEINIVKDQQETEEEEIVDSGISIFSIDPIDKVTKFASSLTGSKSTVSEEEEEETIIPKIIYDGSDSFVSFIQKTKKIVIYGIFIVICLLILYFIFNTLSGNSENVTIIDLDQLSDVALSARSELRTPEAIKL